MGIRGNVILPLFLPAGTFTTSCGLVTEGVKESMQLLPRDRVHLGRILCWRVCGRKSCAVCKGVFVEVRLWDYLPSYIVRLGTGIR